MKYLTSSNVKCASHMKYRPMADVKYSPTANMKVTVCFANEKQLPTEAVWYFFNQQLFDQTGAREHWCHHSTNDQDHKTRGHHGGRDVR